MASGAAVNQGKTPFVEKYFASNPDGNLESVNKAWTAAGNEGSVSESLVGKVRARLGLTGRKTVDAPTPVEAPAKAKAPKRTRKAARPDDVANGSHAPAAGVSSSSHDEDEVLDELEEGIDELIHRLRGLGIRPDVVKALRRARRLLVRGLEA